MRPFRHTITLLIALVIHYRLHAQPHPRAYTSEKTDSVYTPIRTYAGLTHQHQNFFGKAFSYQGIELGVQIRRRVILAAYGATFVSTLAVERANNPLFIYLGHYGLVIGVEQDTKKWVHVGGLVNMGYFSMIANGADFKLLRAENPDFRRSGLVTMPQVYAGLTATNWMQFRIGMSYSFYWYDEHPVVTPSDVDNIALTFGFIFRKVR